MQKKMVVTLVAAGLSLLASTAFAQNSEKCNCWYVGAGIGQSSADLDDFSGFGINVDDEDTGWKIFAGYQWNPNFAIEGGWVDLGEFGLSAAVPGGTFSGTEEIDGFFVDLVGILPLNESFSVFGKVGGIYANTDASYTSTGTFSTALVAAGLPAAASDDDSEFKAKAGVGAQYDFTRNFGVRAEWDRYFLDDEDADLISINAVYTFY